MLSTLSLITSIFFALTAGAYVPDHRLILSRTADNHGKGIYEIEQDVSFRTEGEPLTVRETWFVDGEGLMRVNVEGRGLLQGRLSLQILYKNDQRISIDEEGRLKTNRLPSDWFENFFNFRVSKNIRPLLIASNILPASSANSSHYRREKGQFVYDPEPYLRLSRVGGVVTYAFGEASPAGGTESKPGLWVEQDQFVVRKLRLPSQVSVRADDYERHANGYWLSRNKSVSWGNSIAQIRVNQVKSYGRPKSFSGAFETSSLKTAAKLPEQALVREFYTRFR